MLLLKLVSPRLGTPLLKSFQRHFQLSSYLLAKSFKETENEFGHRILALAGVPNIVRPEDLTPLLSKPAPTDIDRLLSSKDWKSCTIEEVVFGLESLILYCKHSAAQIYDKKFDDFIDAFADRRYELSDDQLMASLKLLMVLPATPSKNTRNYWDLWLALEEVCLQRIPDWDLGKRLLYTDHFYQLNLGKTSKLTYQVVMRMGRNIPKLPKDLFLQLLFFLNVTRSPIEEMIDIEKNLIKSMDQMTIDEIAVVCMGFFKTETRIRNPVLLAKLYEKMKENLSTVDNIPLVNIFKILRYSSKNQEQHLIRSLLDATVPHIPRFSLLSCLHIALLGTDLQQCHEPSLKLIVHRFANEIDKARLKDIERISFIIGLYNFKTPDGLERKLAEMILAQLETRIDEIAQYPKALVQTISFLALIDPCYVTAEMCSACLNPDLILTAYGKNYYRWGREIIFLDSFAEIFFGDTYKGNRMKKREKNYLVNITIDYLPNPEKRDKLTFSNKILLEVFEATQDVFGRSRMYNALPQFQRPDVLLAVDTTTKKSIDISHNFPEKSSSLHLTPEILLEGIREKKTTKVFALVVGGWNQIVRGTSTPTGLLQHKLLQLKMVGYETFLIDWQHWPKSLDGQRIYLKQKVEERLV